jgi:hypothetical protein
MKLELLPVADLHSIVSHHRRLNLAFLGQLLSLAALIVSAVLGEIAFTMTEPVIMLFGGACLVLSWFYCLRLSKAIHGTIGLLLIILLLVPLLNIFIWVVMSRKATSVLQGHGLKVGLLGVKPSGVS